MMKIVDKIKKIRRQRSRALAGDTLIEVALAIGALAFVVIGVSSTMISTLATSQTNLEETMARNEIDIQAEALRYIHNAYTAERSYAVQLQQYKPLWDRIKSLAVTPTEVASLNSIDDCYGFYDTDPRSDMSIYTEAERSFLINTHQLAADRLVTDAATGISTYMSRDPDQVIIEAYNNQSTFQPAGLYPRTIYGLIGLKDTFVNDRNDASKDILTLAEGVWVTAVCSDVIGTRCADRPEYYDFYIRTCWDSTTKHNTSTIGTIIRLHNPDLLTNDIVDPTTGNLNYTIIYDPGQGTPYEVRRVTGTCASTTGCLVPLTHTLGNAHSRLFSGWQDASGRTVTSVSITRANPEVTVYARWDGAPAIYFDKNTTDYVLYLPPTVNSLYSAVTDRFSATIPGNYTALPQRDGYTFLGWSKSRNSAFGDPAYAPGTHFSDMQGSITLYAIWKPTPRIYFEKNDDTANPIRDGTMPSSPLVGVLQSDGSFKATIPTTAPRRPHYIFLGWATSPSAATGNPAYANGTTVTLTGDINLYAIWEYTTYADWAIILSWSTGWRDLDSHTYVGSAHSWYSSKSASYGTTRFILDRDDTNFGKETTSLEGLGNNTVYFCVHAYNSSTVFSNTDAVITVVDAINGLSWTTRPQTSYSAYAYWNALKIQNGRVYFNSNPYGTGCTGW